MSLVTEGRRAKALDLVRVLQLSALSVCDQLQHSLVGVVGAYFLCGGLALVGRRMVVMHRAAQGCFPRVLV